MKVIDREKIKKALLDSYDEMSPQSKEGLNVEDLLELSVDAVFSVLKKNGQYGKVTKSGRFFSPYASVDEEYALGFRIFLPLEEEDNE
jgi:hypothetical protein